MPAFAHDEQRFVVDPAHTMHPKRDTELISSSNDAGVQEKGDRGPELMKLLLEKNWRREAVRVAYWPQKVYNF